MKKLNCFIIIFSILLTGCNLISPEKEDFVVITKAEWNLIEDTTHPKDRPYLPNEDIDDPAKVNTLAYKNNQQALHNTKKIQAALDHFMAQGYKNIRLEKGEYYVGGRLESIVWDSGTQNWRNPEKIRIQPKHSGLRLDLGGSTLKLEPHDRMESKVIEILSDRTGGTRDIKIFNGTIFGDRLQHRFEDTKDGRQMSHEWGSGIDIWTADVENVELYNLTITEVTGDCIGAGGRNVTIRDCNISRGRRNGIVSVGCDGLTIYNNKIHCIFNAGSTEDKDPSDPFLKCQYCDEPGTKHKDSSREYFGSGIGAESCIAFEHTANPYFDKQINIKIYDNWLDGQKPDYRTGTSHDSPHRTYYMDNAINFHWATYAVWIYNNDIIGDFEWSCGGSNTLMENNRFDSGRKGHRISKGLVASGPTLDTGRSAASYVVIRNNYFRNYNIIAGGGNVDDSQPHWRHDYAIVDNILVYDEPRNFSPSLDSDGNQQYSTHYNVGVPMSTGNSYWTGLCVSVDNSVVLGNVFEVRDGGTPTGTSPPWVDWRGADISTVKPLVCAIYIDVYDHEYDRRLPSNLKVDMYISGNTYIGPVWREKHYCLNNSRDILNKKQYERPDDPRIPGYYSETNNYDAAKAMYLEILRKTISVGNIWESVK